MADAKKCDRCGMYYEKNLVYRLEGNRGSFITRMDLVADNSNYKKYDLCDGCIRDLKEFMEHGRIEVAE